MGMTGGQKGITLLELLLAMVLLVMVSSMLYSVLNVAIGFSSKGESKLLNVERNRSLLDLIHRQVHGAWFDRARNRVSITADEDVLKIVTTAPLLNRGAGLVMAFYLYDQEDGILYYSEALDFYNADYDQDYMPRRESMLALMKDVGGISWDFNQAEGVLNIEYGGREYNLVARCWRPEDQ